mmetsp:Transcript_60327/g.152755  ORF Transcript_60327/g.152755 Transcript_60327/m.152755 type:complete len:214 (+) Transcript_60327:171-812(+)
MHPADRVDRLLVPSEHLQQGSVVPVPDVYLGVLRPAANELFAGPAETTSHHEAALGMPEETLHHAARCKVPQADDWLVLRAGDLPRDVHQQLLPQRRCAHRSDRVALRQRWQHAAPEDINDPDVALEIYDQHVLSVVGDAQVLHTARYLPTVELHPLDIPEVDAPIETRRDKVLRVVEPADAGHRLIVLSQDPQRALAPALRRRPPEPCCAIA